MSRPLTSWDHGDFESSMSTEPGVPPPVEPPKLPWYKRLADAVGTAFGQAKFGG